MKVALRLFSGLQDRRQESKLMHNLLDIVIITVIGVMCGCTDWEEVAEFGRGREEVLREYLKLTNGIPSHDTFRRVFGLIAPEELQQSTAQFLVQEISQMKKALGIKDTSLRHISVDGKEQRGTGRKYGTAEKVSNLQTLHCYDITNGICLQSIPISEKTNEIPTAQNMLRNMSLKDCVVTFDAMNTQKDTVSVITDGKGHYVGGLKGSQQLFYEEVVLFFSDDELSSIAKKEKHFRSYTEKSRNRIEKRSYYMTTDIKWFADLHKWAGLKAFVCCVTETEDLVTGQKTQEQRYYITSLTDIEICADSIRTHWGIENQLHWHLDVTFAEDDNSTMDKNAFNNLSIMNKMVLSLLKLIQPTHEVGLKIIRKLFGWDLIKQLSNLLALLDEEQIEIALLSTPQKNKA